MKLRMLFFILAASTAFTPAFGFDRDKIDFMIYGGNFTDTDLQHILMRAETDYKDSFLMVGAVNYLLDTNIRSLRFETEGQIGKHFGRMNHFEFNGVLITRWVGSLFDRHFSIAFGEGLSLATRQPELENPRDPFGRREEKSAEILNYLMLEVELGLGDYPRQPRVFLRIHHRSGVFGTYCPPTCGSNFITYGVKFSLN